MPERFLLFQSKHSKQPEKGSDFGRGYCSPHLDNETKHCFTSSTNYAGLDSPGARLIGLGAQSRRESEWRRRRRRSTHFWSHTQLTQLTQLAQLTHVCTGSTRSSHSSHKEHRDLGDVHARLLAYNVLVDRDFGCFKQLKV